MKKKVNDVVELKDENEVNEVDNSDEVFPKYKWVIFSNDLEIITTIYAHRFMTNARSIEFYDRLCLGDNKDEPKITFNSNTIGLIKKFSKDKDKDKDNDYYSGDDSELAFIFKIGDYWMEHEDTDKGFHIPFLW